MAKAATKTKAPKPAAKKQGRTSARKPAQTTTKPRGKPAIKPQARVDAFSRMVAESAGPFGRHGVFTALERPTNARFEAFQSENGDVAEIDVYDVIGTFNLNADVFRATLKTITARRIVLNINSPGGSVFDAFAMYTDLRAHGAHITVRVRGLAASAASLLAMAGDEIEIAENGFLMIHNAWVMALGDRREMAHAATVLTKIDKRLAETYAAAMRARGNEDDDAATVALMMDDETWLDADDAIDAGLADSKIGAEAAEAMAGLDVSHFAKAPSVLVRAVKTAPSPAPKAAPEPDLTAIAAAIRGCITALR